MHARTLAWVALVLLAVVPAACGSRGAHEHVPRAHEVSVQAMQFVPASLTVTVGDTVVWRNPDIVPHTVTSRAWDSGSIAAGGTWRKVMTTSGVFAYECSFHPTMKGTITVGGGGPS